MSAIWGWAQEAEQPEKCIRITPRHRAVRCLVARRQLGVQCLCPLDRPLLGLHDSEAAELGAGAGNDPTLEGSGERRVRLHERLGQQVVEAILGNAGDNEVLVDADTDAAVTVRFGQAGQLNQFDTVHPADRDRTAHIEQSRLLLRVDPT